MQNKRGTYLSSRSIGLDHIDREAAFAAGICVENIPYSPEGVAEYAVMLALMALRNAGCILRRADHCDFRLEARRAPELRDLTVGVVGTGRIGRAVIERLTGFGCAILAHNPRPTADAAHVGLDELLGRSDLVTLHLPLTGETRHLFDRERIARMKRGSSSIPRAARWSTPRPWLIFEKFYRLDASRATKTGGAGLGLAIAKEIVEAHGGRIAVKSDAEQTAFTVVIPGRQNVPGTAASEGSVSRG